MKRLLAVLIVLSVGIGVGIAGDKVAKKLKFPYAGEKWNKEITMTKLEYECMKTQFAAIGPMKIEAPEDEKPCFEITRIYAEPKTEALSLIIEVNTLDTKAVTKEQMAWAMNTGVSWWCNKVPYGKSGKKLPCDFYLKTGGKIIAHRDSSGTTKTVLDPK